MTLTLDDRVALEWLVYRMNAAADARDLDATLAVYTADAVWDGPLGRFEGRDGIAAFVRTLAGNESLSGTRHWPSNILVEGDSAAGRAVVTHDSLLVQATDEGPRLHALSRSVSEAVRVDGEWLFARRTVTPHRAPGA